jgi:hypothetical protein
MMQVSGSCQLNRTVIGSNAITYASYSNYEPTGKIGQIMYANGTAARYTYDELSTKLYGIVTTDPTGLAANDLQSKSYSYTAAG